MHHSRMVWLQRQPDLRMSVIAKLAGALKVSPAFLFKLIYEEATRPGFSGPDRGWTHSDSPTKPKRRRKPASAIPS